MTIPTPMRLGCYCALALLAFACGPERPSGDGAQPAAGEKSAPAGKPAAGAAPRITNWGPTEIEAGKGFNVQPDGSSVMWVVVENLSKDVVIVLNGVEIKQTMRNLKSGQVSAPIPKEILSKPGEYEFYIYDPVTKVRSETESFEVKE